MVANPRINIKKLPVSEAAVSKAVVDFLEANGWLVMRLQSGLFRTKDGRYIRVGKKGLPDTLALRGLTTADSAAGYSQSLMIEFKRGKGGVLSPEQVSLHDDLRRRKLSVMVVNSLDSFFAQYNELFGGLA